MGILAQVHTALRWITGDLATKKRRSGNEDDAEDEDDQAEDEEAVETEAPEVPPEDEGDDLGEVIARVEDSDDEDTMPKPAPAVVKKENTSTATTTSTKPTKKRPRQEIDSDEDSSHIKSLKALAKPSVKSSEAEPIARSDKKRKVEEDYSIPRPKEVQEANNSSEKKGKKDKKEKKDKEKDRSKKTKKKKKGGDEFDDLFSGLL